jgi:exosortase E/protease (VPEID-CTERM system)
MTIRSARLLLYDRAQTRMARYLSFGLLQRILVLAALFTAELLLLSVWLDNGALAEKGGVTGLVGQWGAWAVRGIVGFAAIFVTFAYLRNKAALAGISRQAEQEPVSLGLLTAHLLAMAAFAKLSWALYGGHLAALPPHVSGPLWLLVGCSAIAFGAFWLIPPRLWVQLVRETGWLSACALVVVVSACVMGNYSRLLWGPATHLTFVLAKTILRPFVSSVVADPATMILGSAKFSVEIAPECSGLEGVGLMLAFVVFWLWLFRRECRFPQALALIPAGVATIFLLNAVRIAVLILIGNAGAPQIALGGFHSQAGWIAFNVVALGLSIAATRVPWLMTAEHTAGRITADISSENPTAPYLLPFLSILAIGMLTTAASSDFEWLYPIRFLAAAGVLWTFRKSYSSLDWKFSWFGPAIGVLVFAMWIAIDSSLKTAPMDAMPHALAEASAPIRITWIVFRALAAIVTVPIAEELAFRGFLLRRLISPDFEAVPPRTFTWLALGISSLAFGLLHGHLWLAGALAGLLYAWAMLRRGRIGEAVVAHATTNALLAAYVLLFHQWHLWS